MNDSPARLLRRVSERLAAAGIDSAAAEAAQLLEAVSGLTRFEQLTGSEPLTAAQLERLEQLLQRREAREPLQLILGRSHFHHLELQAAPGVLIPRPETETLVELALELLAPLSSPLLLDVGTGSGAIALALAQARPDARVLATDVSDQALELAARNAHLYGLTLELRKADLLDGIAEAGQLDLLVSNPPYLPDSDRGEISPEVKQDPETALFAGPDGLAVYRRLLQQAQAKVKPGAWLLLELDPRNVRQAAAEAEGPEWTDVEVLPDLTGRDRFLRLLKRQS